LRRQRGTSGYGRPGGGEVKTLATMQARLRGTSGYGRPAGGEVKTLARMPRLRGTTGYGRTWRRRGLPYGRSGEVKTLATMQRGTSAYATEWRNVYLLSECRGRGDGSVVEAAAPMRRRSRRRLRERAEASRGRWARAVDANPRE
jgi:hypothetical protein